MLKLLTVIGARPQFIKASAVSRAIAARDGVEEVILHTGQHYDKNMSEVFFDQLDLPRATYNLGIEAKTHGRMTGEMLMGIEEVLLSEMPDWVLIYGDTNSTLAGALASAKLNIPLAHIEAGLRSFNRRMPEEINRIVADHTASLLLCPTVLAVEQLREEGMDKVVNRGELLTFDQAKSTDTYDFPLVANVGDVMFDSMLHFRERAIEESRIIDTLNLKATEYVLVTVHRSETTDDESTLESVVNELLRLSSEISVVFPIHPRTRKSLESSHRLDSLLKAPGIIVTEPHSYLDFVALESRAKAIVTDSGGVQKEAYFLGVPCFTLRNETEWRETVTGGWNRLLGQSAQGLREAVLESKAGDGKPGNEFGRGDSAEIIVALLETLKGVVAN